MSATANLIISSGIAVIIAGIALILKSYDLLLLGGVILAAGLFFNFYSGKTLKGKDFQSDNASQGITAPRVISPELVSLRRAVTDAREAAKWFSGINREASFHRLSAAFVKVTKSHGIPGFEFEVRTQRGLLMLMINYVDCFLPLLEDGEYAAARYAAHSFLEG